jgi:hypothetical protein
VKGFVGVGFSGEDVVRCVANVKISIRTLDGSSRHCMFGTYEGIWRRLPEASSRETMLASELQEQ